MHYEYNPVIIGNNFEVAHFKCKSTNEVRWKICSFLIACILNETFLSKVIETILQYLLELPLKYRGSIFDKERSFDSLRLHCIFFGYDFKHLVEYAQAWLVFYIVVKCELFELYSIA